MFKANIDILMTLIVFGFFKRFIESPVTWIKAINRFGLKSFKAGAYPEEILDFL